MGRDDGDDCYEADDDGDDCYEADVDGVDGVVVVADAGDDGDGYDDDGVTARKR